MKDERQAAVLAVLEAGHIPAGMELFAAGNESQLETIKRWIDDSDVYLLVLGGRYGSIEPNSKKSYIELEFDHALERDKSLFSLVIKEDALDDKTKRYGREAIETANQSKLDLFRKKVLSFTSGIYEDEKDIRLGVQKSLNENAKDSALIGWTRKQAANEDTVSTISENPSLAISELKQVLSDNMDFPELPEVSDVVTIGLNVYGGGYNSAPVTVRGTWANFFPLFAASLSVDYSDWNDEFFFSVDRRASGRALAELISNTLNGPASINAFVVERDFEKLHVYFVEAGLMSDGTGREPFEGFGAKLIRRVAITPEVFGGKLEIIDGKLDTFVGEVPF
jgi:hypothetical protein